MADNLGGGAKGKGLDFFGAIRDLIIFVLLVGGAAAGGYFVGIQQRLGTIQFVPPGTLGAVSIPTQTIGPGASSNSNSSTSSNTSSSTSANPPATTSSNDPKPASSSSQKGKTRYWLISSGSDGVGYLIKVLVNGDQVDNFFRPGKIVEITSQVKPGKNDLEFEAKMLEDIAKHKGDASKEIVLKLVSGTAFKEDFKPSDVVLTYKRTAAEDQDFSDSKSFTAKD